MLLSIAYQIACRIPKYKLALEELVTSQELTRTIILKDYNVLGIFQEFLQVPLCTLHEDELPGKTG